MIDSMATNSLYDRVMLRYLIGIDLGTTNSALAYVDLEKRPAGSIVHFRVPQLVAPGEIAPRDLLPFLVGN